MAHLNDSEDGDADSDRDIIYVDRGMQELRQVSAVLVEYCLPATCLALARLTDAAYVEPVQFSAMQLTSRYHLVPIFRGVFVIPSLPIRFLFNSV